MNNQSRIATVVAVVGLLALSQNSWATLGAALPPDVRRWLCPAASSQIEFGAMPLFRLGPSDLLGHKPHTGHSPKIYKATRRRGVATAAHQAAEPNLTWPMTVEAKLGLLLFPSTSISQSPATQPDLPIDSATRTQVIGALLSRLNESYVLPDAATRMEQSIRARMQKGEYDKINSSSLLAQTLTAHLAEIAKDKHLSVGFSYDPIPISSEQKEPSAEDRERFRRMASSANFGFEKVERLNGNIGYMELDGFVTAELGAETAIAAMQFLANTDALIIDLRYNGGGVPGTAQLIISYLFGETPVHYHSIYWRQGNRTEQFWTLPYVPGRRYVGKPVYILMGKRTLSAPESFAYSLQAQKRVTVVGEVSAGGANPGKVFRINDHFQVFVPTGRAINPVTGTNWEGTGVKPDIETTFANALKTAHLTALRNLLETSTSERKKEQLKSVIEEVEKQL